MTTRTSRTAVTFRRPFSLSGVDEVQPAGTYTVETDEELLEGLSFPVWRRTATVILLGTNAGNGGLTQVVGVEPVALEAAQASDAVILPEAAVEATLDDLRHDGVLQRALRSARLVLHEFKQQLSDFTARMPQARSEGSSDSALGHAFRDPFTTVTAQRKAP
jgi:hypothetical protein